MRILEMFKDGVKVAELDVSCLSFRQMVDVMRDQVKCFGRRVRLLNTGADEFSDEDMDAAGEYWDRLVDESNYARGTGPDRYPKNNGY